MQTSDGRPLRILVGADVPPDPNSGASGTVFQTNEALRRLGHDVDEIWEPELRRRIQHGNLHYLLELPRAYRRVLRQRMEQQTYDVVEFNQPHAHLAAADFRRRSTHGVFVNRSHGHEIRVEEQLAPWRHLETEGHRLGLRRVLSGWLNPLLARHWKIVAGSADGFHVSCSEDAEFLADRYGVSDERIGVISQGVPELFINTPPQAMVDARRRRLLYVGQWSFVKAPMILARAVTLLLESRSDLAMTWVCGRAHHAAAQALFPASVRARITFSDWRPQNELLQIYDEHGIFLFPSFFEGFGKAPLEAMSRGLCVVASNTGGMRDFISDGVSGRLVPVGCPERFAQATSELLDNPVVCEQMSHQALTAARRYTWDRCAAELTHFYRRLLALRHSSNHRECDAEKRR
jgi:glycosyltransferase involved in cell wall biosynthesis